MTKYAWYKLTWHLSNRSIGFDEEVLRLSCMCFCRSNDTLRLVLFPSKASKLVSWSKTMGKGMSYIVSASYGLTHNRQRMIMIARPISLHASPALSTCRVKSVSHAALLCSQILFIIHLKATTFLRIDIVTCWTRSRRGFGTKKSSFLCWNVIRLILMWTSVWSDVCGRREGKGNEKMLIRLLSNHGISYANNFMQQTPETYLESRSIEAFVPWVCIKHWSN